MLRLYVCVLEAKDLPVKNSYVKLKLGKFKSKTRILRHTSNPVWYEEFVFRVLDAAHDELVVSILNHNHEPVVVNGGLDLLGEVRIPVDSVASEDKQILPPTWFSLECPKTEKFVNIYCGLLNLFPCSILEISL
ncbi:hypothetical protein QN277_025576 [Acacia crassicarpa]|uniref:C2 domain-containing protein n=1 Tax=Acacia crassicarpa TaxID=499986 RepID=A0AAE1K598_9FABA|nr:hypothetical protein QN277_025576 [Acacia crassicarpa]